MRRKFRSLIFGPFAFGVLATLGLTACATSSTSPSQQRRDQQAALDGIHPSTPNRGFLPDSIQR
jgi:hypothetical protein